MPRIRVLADSTLAGTGELYVEPVTTEDGPRALAMRAQAEV